MFLITDDWKRTTHPFKKLDFGKWELVIPPNPDGSCPIPHNSNIKVCIYIFKHNKIILNCFKLHRHHLYLYLTSSFNCFTWANWE